MKSNKGFTLIELMIVIAVIGIISAVLIGGFNDYSQDFKIVTEDKEINVKSHYLDDGCVVYKDWYGEQGTLCGDFEIKRRDSL